MRALLVGACAALCVSMPVAAQVGERELFDNATGVAVTLPADWDFFMDQTTLRARSDDGRAMVFMMATDQRFEQELLTFEETAGTKYFKDIVFTDAVFLMGTKRGALEEAVLMHGNAIDRKDGEAVDFSAMLVKAGNRGELIFGAWKDRDHRDIVRNIVRSVHVRLPELESGRMLTDKMTGASITIPDQWSVFAARGGLLAYSPDRGAMLLIVKAQEDFEATKKMVRKQLEERVFESPRVGRLTEFTEIDPKGFGALRAADGTAKDRVTGEPLEFMVLTAERTDQPDKGVLILGAWKDETYKESVREMLKSLHLKEAYTG